MRKWTSLCLAMVAVMLGALAGAPAQDKYAMRFGINGGMYPGAKGAPAQAYLRVTRDLDELGMVWLRHVGRGQTWFEMQPTRDTWDFSPLDAVINQNDHPLVFNVWGQVGKVYPFNADMPWDQLNALGDKRAIMDYIKAHAVDLGDPVQRAEAEVYVKTFVQRYGDVVQHWEIGNEGMRGDASTFDVAAYTCRWIKEAKPDATVLLGTFAGDDDQTFSEGLEAFRGLVAQGIGEHCDIVTMHYYGDRTDLVNKLEARFDEVKRAMAQHGVEKPIWVTETSTSSYEQSVLSGPTSEAAQAQDVVKRLVTFAAKGAQRVFWHGYRHAAPGNKFYGCNLIDAEAGPKPGYYTYKLLVDKLGYFTAVEALPVGDDQAGLRVYKFTVGEPVLVAWSTAPGGAVEVGSASSLAPVELDLSQHLDGDQVTVTHIVEEGEGPPEVEQVPTSSVELTESPVFIEAT
jgi:hypothetical protein